MTPMRRRIKYYGLFVMGIIALVVYTFLAPGFSSHMDVREVRVIDGVDDIYVSPVIAVLNDFKGQYRVRITRGGINAFTPQWSQPFPYSRNEYPRCVNLAWWAGRPVYLPAGSYRMETCWRVLGVVAQPEGCVISNFIVKQAKGSMSEKIVDNHLCMGLQ